MVTIKGQSVKPILRAHSASLATFKALHTKQHVSSDSRSFLLTVEEMEAPGDTITQPKSYNQPASDKPAFKSAFAFSHPRWLLSHENRGWG